MRLDISQLTPAPTPRYTTLEYELPSRVAGPPVFVFVLDTCVTDDELDELKVSERRKQERYGR